jgi:adenylosuccinate synthase
VAKAYATRVGNGPFPTEMPPEEGARMRELGVEFGATTGRPRRCGWLDAVLLRRGVAHNGATSLAITKLDVLDTLPEVKICTAYRVNGETLDDFPTEPWLLDRLEPQYETLPGWKQSTVEVRRWEDLPSAARVYLERVEELSGAPVEMVSLGSARDQTLLRF